MIPQKFIAEFSKIVKFESLWTKLRLDMLPLQEKLLFLNYFLDN